MSNSSEKVEENNIENTPKLDTNQFTFKFWDLAVWVTLIPILGYGITYCMEVGKAAFFDYPVSLIKIDINNVSKVSIIMICIISFIVIPMFLILKKDSSKKLIEKQKKDFEKTFIGYLILAICLFVFSVKIGSYFFMFVLLFVMSVYTVYVLFKLKFYIYTIAISILLTLIFTFLYGYAAEKARINYTLIEYAGNNYVVINGSQEKFLIAPVNLKKKEIKPEYSLIEIKTKLVKSENKTEETLTLRNEETGHLKLKGKEATAMSLFKYLDPFDQQLDESMR